MLTRILQWRLFSHSVAEIKFSGSAQRVATNMRREAFFIIFIFFTSQKYEGEELKQNKIPYVKNMGDVGIFVTCLKYGWVYFFPHN